MEEIERGYTILPVLYIYIPSYRVVRYPPPPVRQLIVIPLDILSSVADQFSSRSPQRPCPPSLYPPPTHHQVFMYVHEDAVERIFKLRWGATVKSHLNRDILGGGFSRCVRCNPIPRNLNGCAVVSLHRQTQCTSGCRQHKYSVNGWEFALKCKFG